MGGNPPKARELVYGPVQNGLIIAKCLLEHLTETWGGLHRKCNFPDRILKPAPDQDEL
jgi:hypothetical protein